MEHRIQEVNGLRLHYTVAGAGPDIVFVHGWGSSRRMWTTFLPDLARQFRCWTLDLPGFGDSEKPAPRWYSIPNFTAIVAHFIDGQHIAPAGVVGHSMGGMVVLNLAARRPAVVQRVAAINPVVSGRATLRPLARPKTSTRMLDWFLRLSPSLMQPLLTHPLGHRVGGLTQFRRRTEDFAKSNAESLMSSGRAIVTYDVTPILDQVSAPTLVLVGAKDINVPPSEGRRAAARIPGARLLVMPTGHLPTDERPAETLRHLQRFFS
jgi:pimeloyl-ACP methyl ester carboxylesterase